MKENVDKHIEALVDKAMQSLPLETPSFEFTQHVMAEVKATSVSVTTQYKPLISKQVWGMIFTGIAAISIWAFIGTPIEGNSWFDTIDYGFITNNKVTHTLSGFKFSQTTGYAIIMLSIMVCIQIPFLKHYFNKRLLF